MPWVKLDDQFFRHPKVLDLGKDAKLLHLAALAYCSSQLTDGHLSAGAVRLAASEVDVDQTAIDELVGAGLWEINGDGYAIHDYLDYNPPAEEVRARRADAEQRKAAGRRKGFEKVSQGHDGRFEPKSEGPDDGGTALSGENPAAISGDEKPLSRSQSPSPTESPDRSISQVEPEAVADSARAEKTAADSSSSLFSLVCQSLRVNEGDDVDGLVRDGVSAFSSLRPELEAKRCRLHYPNWMRTPPAWRIGKFIEWMKREERYHAASNVRELPPPKEQPAAELTTYPPSGVELWDRLRVEFVKDNAINRLMCRRPTDWMFEELHALSFDGTTLRMGTPWPPGHFREEWAGVIRNYCTGRLGHYAPLTVEWVPETAEAMA